MEQYILALDEGTTSSRAILFDRRGQIASVGQYDFPQIYPQTGWVEHDPGDIWSSESRAAADALRPVRPGQVMGIGVTNQRETTVLWDKNSGEPVYNAIVWQCRRTAELCEELKKQGLTERIQSDHRPAAGCLFLPPPRSAGYWIMCLASGNGPCGERSCSARWRRISSGS